MIKIDSAKKIALICAAGIAVNMLGARVAQSLDLPIFLDTYGTIFIAALGGYVPGIAVGFFTNLLGALFNSAEMYFGFVSIAVAIITAFLYQRGYYDNIRKVVLTIPFTSLTTSFFGALIEEYIYFAQPSDTLMKFWLHYRENFFNEFPDKALAILVAFVLLKIFPAELKDKFRLLGKMQAPLTDEMQQELSNENKFISSLHTRKLFNLIPIIKTESKFIRSLRTKMIVTLISITLLVAFSISAISYMIYRQSAINEHIRIADGISSMVVSEINPYRVDEFLEKGHHAEGYNEVERQLRKIRVSNSNIKFLYVYKIMEDGCHVVFDLDTATVEASLPGEIEEFDPTFEKYVPDLLAGRPIPPIQSNDKYGDLLTIYKPVYNSVGKCVCYAGIDFSMEEINDYGRTFIAKVIALFSGAVIFIFVLGLAFIENNIILPVNTMAYCAKNFAYDSEEAREQNIERIKNLEIKTNDEIENLYSAFVKTTEDSMNYFEKFKRAKIQVAVMDELAHTDSLTGIKNKTAYTEATMKLDADIAAGRADFCIIMIDVNYLKKVNDTYGHERGNEYLINACDLACSTFGTGNVYRVGGDEFVVILDGENLAHCEEMVAKIRASIKKFRADNSLQAWEKVSAAVGVAYYRAGVDKTAEEVFKRADEQMYKNKLAMKAVRKD